MTHQSFFDTMEKNTKGDGAQLLELLHARNVEATMFFKIMSENGYRSQNTQRKLISRDTVNIKKSDLCLICSLFGFAPEEFGYPADYFKSEYSNKDAGLYCYNTRREGMKEYRPFLENFDREANRHLLSATEELLVCDYVDKTRGIGLKENVNFYHEKAASFFDRLEQRLSKISSLKYIRLLQVPLGAKANGFEEGLSIILQDLFLEHFAHICRCLQNHSDQCSFVVVTCPFKLHTYFVVDNRVALTEYHRYDVNGIPTPDMLFVNMRDPHNRDAVGSVYINSCRDEFHRMLESRFNLDGKISKPRLIRGMFKLEKNLREKLGQLENELDHCEKSGLSGISTNDSFQLFEGCTTLDKKTEANLISWEKVEESLESTRRNYCNIMKKMEILGEIYKIQVPKHYQRR